SWPIDLLHARLHSDAERNRGLVRGRIEGPGTAPSLRPRIHAFVVGDLAIRHERLCLESVERHAQLKPIDLRAGDHPAGRIRPGRGAHVHEPIQPNLSCGASAAARNARQTTSEVAGIGTSSTPAAASASHRALTTTAVAGVIPLSPPPFTRSGLPAV